MDNKNKTPDQIADSWKGKFTFIKESEGKKGLRSPQIGALHALMSHIEYGEESAIVVMPTGTGKTETMISFLIANACRKVFIVVPSDALRTQTYRKFKTLGLLPKLGLVPNDIILPKVKLVKESLDETSWIETINDNNVIITTMALADKTSPRVRQHLREKISYLFVDEAHHSKAETWNSFISIFPTKNVLQFTATPFRNDGKKLNGKIIFNFPLKEAKRQGYYQTINNYYIVKFTEEDADKAIADKAVEILKEDLSKGFDHILMARCKDTKRAKEVFKIYEQHKDLNPVLIYSSSLNKIAKLKAILEKKHRIIVCVNMLGEGFDLPELKIAAIHDERQSLPITLQFIGRFTRTNGKKIGNASFITNIAKPPIQREINSLYQMDADWNYILPRINDNAAKEKETLSEYLRKFNGNLKDEISLEDIRPALSTEIYTTTSTETSFHNWKSFFKSIKKDTYLLHALSDDTLVVAIGKQSNVKWGTTKSVQNLDWDCVIVYFDAFNKRIYLNATYNIQGEAFLKNIFHNPQKIQSDILFRVFADIARLRLFNVGARMPQGIDISFTSFFGKSVQEGINQLTQGKLLKNNIYGVGSKDGERTSIGCSYTGKIWSSERTNLMEFKEWCKEVGSKVFNENIDTNIVLQNMLSYEEMKSFPSAYPISIDWNPNIYKQCTQQVKFGNEVRYFDNIEMTIDPSTNIGKEIVFNFKTEDKVCTYQMTIDINNKKLAYKHIGGDVISFIKGNEEISLEEFLKDNPITVYYADNSISFGINLTKPKAQAEPIPDSLITTYKWEGVDLKKESQETFPYITDSIQYYMVRKIIDEYDFLIDDDGSLEMSDLIGIVNSDRRIDITLYHLKYAMGGKVSNQIKNLYEVCGQAQKSLKWKYMSGNHVFQHILERNEKRVKKNLSSRILKGTPEDIIKLREEASYEKEIRYHVVIVQPGMSKKSCTDDMKVLLGNTVQVLFEMANMDCRVICSE